MATERVDWPFARRRASRLLVAIFVAIWLGGAGFAFQPPTAALAQATPEPGPERLTAMISSTVPVSVLAHGLVNPRGLAAGPDRWLYVAEAGRERPGGRRSDPQARFWMTGHSGRVSRISLDGWVEPVVSGLPSFFDGQVDYGAADVAFLDDNLYLVTAAGGFEVRDPAYDNLLLLVEPTASERLKPLFNLTEYNLARMGLERHQVSSWTQGAGGAPFSLAELDGALYVSDSVQRHVTRITPDGRVRRMLQHPPGSRMITGLASGPDGGLYLAELGELPRDGPNAKITRLGPGGLARTQLQGLPDVLDLTFDQQGNLYLLESARPGRREPLGGRIEVVRPGGARELLASGLSFPSALTFGPDGNLYVSSDGPSDGGGKGLILKLQLASPSDGRSDLLWSGLSVFGSIVLLVGVWVGISIRARQALS